MPKTSILYVPIGRKTFDLEAGELQRKKSSEFLHSVTANVIEPEEIITSPEDLEVFLENVNSEDIVASIYQSVTFADGEFIEALIKKVEAPVIVWSVREPSVGGRLRLNSLTGGTAQVMCFDVRIIHLALYLGMAMKRKCKRESRFSLKFKK